MEVECPWHPGASTIGSQLLELRLLPWLTNPCNPGMSHLTEGISASRHIDRNVTVETRKVSGEKTRNYAWRQNIATMNTRDPLACEQQKNADCTNLLMLAQSMHWRWCMNEHSKTQENADPWWMHWSKGQDGTMTSMWMHWYVCIAIPQTLKGTQMLFVDSLC